MLAPSSVYTHILVTQKHFPKFLHQTLMSFLLINVFHVNWIKLSVQQNKSISLTQALSLHESQRLITKSSFPFRLFYPLYCTQKWKTIAQAFWDTPGGSSIQHTPFVVGNKVTDKKCAQNFMHLQKKNLFQQSSSYSLWGATISMRIKWPMFSSSNVWKWADGHFCADDGKNEHLACFKVCVSLLST